LGGVTSTTIKTRKGERRESVILSLLGGFNHSNQEKRKEIAYIRDPICGKGGGDKKGQ